MSNNVRFKVFALKHHYKMMVANRLRKSIWRGHVSDTALKKVAERLTDIRFAKIFVEAQFDSMPEDFCMEKFGVKYPPVNVVFGGKCWDRYREYVDKGVRNGR